MLDRLSLLVPDWTERSAADLGVTLVELLAYAADNLSYRQDAIANEAYLATARQRVSVRRHARLVDYALHDGCNARAFVHVRRRRPTSRARHRHAAAHPHAGRLRCGWRRTARTCATRSPPAPWCSRRRTTSTLDERLNRLSLLHLGRRLGCCLPRGATQATLAGIIHALHSGDVLVFEEVVSPTTFTD